MMASILVLISIFAAAQAACDNGCSGHGSCGIHGVCKCYDNWGLGLSHLSGDCSERICPYDLAWVDTPNKIGTFHRYAECSNRGICNSGTGECECFPGYEGRACTRTTCPNDCSGHGRCRYIQDMPYGSTPQEYAKGEFLPQTPKTFTYNEWDKSKTRGCICDPQWGDVDCSKRLCDHGTDVMDLREDLLVPATYQTQSILFVSAKSGAAHAGGNNTLYGSSYTFALTFKSKLNETFTTQPINLYNNENDFRQFILNIRDALLRLPNRVIDKVDVAGSVRNGLSQAYVNITFTGDNVQGPQNLLVVEAYECGDGCTPKLSGIDTLLYPGTQNITQVQLSDFYSFECGRRGKCDYETGVCQCFAGFSGPTCGTISCLV
jgi:hypothetical protein